MASIACGTMKGANAARAAFRLPLCPRTSSHQVRSFASNCIRYGLPCRPAAILRQSPHTLVRQLRVTALLPQRRKSSDDASTKDGGLNRTALHDLHVRNGGKMVPFGGFSMPVQYSDLSVGESHKWTREKASLFDVGHMYAFPYPIA